MDACTKPLGNLDGEDAENMDEGTKFEDQQLVRKVPGRYSPSWIATLKVPLKYRD